MSVAVLQKTTGPPQALTGKPPPNRMLTLFPGDQVFRQYEGCVGNSEVFPFSLPNLGADEIFSTGVSTGEHAVIVVSRM